jgi:hypothetical protein
MTSYPTPINTSAFNEGAECRIVYNITDYEGALRNCPFMPGRSAENPWLFRSFMMGWADADAELIIKHGR